MRKNKWEEEERGRYRAEGEIKLKKIYREGTHQDPSDSMAGEKAGTRK